MKKWKKIIIDKSNKITKQNNVKNVAINTCNHPFNPKCRNNPNGGHNIIIINLNFGLISIFKSSKSPKIKNKVQKESNSK